MTRGFRCMLSLYHAIRDSASAIGFDPEWSIKVHEYRNMKQSDKALYRTETDKEHNMKLQVNDSSTLRWDHQRAVGHTNSPQLWLELGKCAPAMVRTLVLILVFAVVRLPIKATKARSFHNCYNGNGNEHYWIHRSLTVSLFLQSRLYLSNRLQSHVAILSSIL